MILLISIAVLVLVGFFGYLFTGQVSESKSFLSTVNLRGLDSLGGGHFGAPRGNRTHQGLDIVSLPNEPFPLPFDCEIIRFGTVYPRDNRYHLVEIRGIRGTFKDWTCKLMYLGNGSLRVGQTFSKFNKVGVTENLHLKYEGITNHIHLELRKPNSELVDPQQYL